MTFSLWARITHSSFRITNLRRESFVSERWSFWYSAAVFKKSARMNPHISSFFDIFYVATPFRPSLMSLHVFLCNVFGNSPRVSSCEFCQFPWSCIKRMEYPNKKKNEQIVSFETKYELTSDSCKSICEAWINDKTMLYSQLYVANTLGTNLMSTLLHECKVYLKYLL